ncbi:hypothetical protein MMC07_000812 [Pseudocyphellaria aurata]|nr:hypothetical protein [Pseudocyphellaria aurata]
MTSLALGLLSGARFLTGFSTIVATNPTLALFQFPTSSMTTYPYRLFGSRDAVVAGLLWTANTPELLKQALLAGTLIDSIDLISTCAAFLSGDLNATATAWAGGGIVIFLGIQLWALNDLRSQKNSKIQ